MNGPWAAKFTGRLHENWSRVVDIETLRQFRYKKLSRENFNNLRGNVDRKRFQSKNFIWSMRSCHKKSCLLHFFPSFRYQEKVFLHFSKSQSVNSWEPNFRRSQFCRYRLSNVNLDVWNQNEMWNLKRLSTSILPETHEEQLKKPWFMRKNQCKQSPRRFVRSDWEKKKFVL